MSKEKFAITSDLQGVVMMTRRKVNSKKFVYEPVYVEFDDNGIPCLETDHKTHGLIRAWSAIDRQYVGVLAAYGDDGRLYNTTVEQHYSITLWHPTEEDFSKRIGKLDVQIGNLQEERDALKAIWEQVM